MSHMPGDSAPASLTYRRRHDTEDDHQVARDVCACLFLVLLSLDETLDGDLVGSLMCPECGKHWTRTSVRSPGSLTPPSLRSEATPSVWEQRRSTE